MECVRALYRRKRTLLWIASLGVVAALLISVAQPVYISPRLRSRSRESTRISSTFATSIPLRPRVPTMQFTCRRRRKCSSRTL
jgi:hypothetical protein